MASTHKKVLIRVGSQLLSGFVDPGELVQLGQVHMLTQQGQMQAIPLERIKIIYFVREFEEAETILERRTFSNRPRNDGVWVRMSFRDREVMEGILANDLAQLDGAGFHLQVPHSSGVLHRAYVPKTALTEMIVLGVNGPQRRRRAVAPAETQIGLFPGLE